MEESGKTTAKIRKLLELSKNPNVHEAQLALAKARKLLYEQKKKEGETGLEEYLETDTGITFTLNRDLWTAYLADVMAKRHCCVTYQKHRKPQGRTYTVLFLGTRQNAEVCRESFVKTHEYITALKKAVGAGNDKGFEGYFNDFVYGFIRGLEELYTKDDESLGGAVITQTTPEAVKNVLRFIKGKKKETAILNRKSFEAGKGYGKGR